MNVRIKRIGEHDLPLPAYAKPGDAGLDLRWTGELKQLSNSITTPPWLVPRCDDGHIELESGARLLLGTGFAVSLPNGYEAQVRGRSGLSSRGFMVALGTIDGGYTGQLYVLATAIDEIAIAPGDRIAQLVIAPVVTATLEEVQELGDSERGASGFGSTGVA